MDQPSSSGRRSAIITPRTAFRKAAGAPSRGRELARKRRAALLDSPGAVSERPQIAFSRFGLVLNAN